MQALWRTIGGSILDRDFEAALSARANAIDSIELFLEVWGVEGSTPMMVLAPIQRIYETKKAEIRKTLDELQQSVSDQWPALSFDDSKDASAVLGLAVCSHIFAWRLHQHTEDLPTFRYFVRNNHLQSFDFTNEQIDVLYPLLKDEKFVSKLEEFMLIAWLHPKEAKTWALCDGSVPTALHASLTAEAALADAQDLAADSTCDDTPQGREGKHDQEALFAVDTKQLVTVIMDPAGVEFLAEALQEHARAEGHKLEAPERRAAELQRTLRTTLTEVLDVVWEIQLQAPPEEPQAMEF